MSSCFGFRRRLSDDSEPLLPRYDDDTVLQRRLHQKLHTYQMLRALTKGYMPSNEQTIANLRTLLSADILDPNNDQLSEPGRALVHYAKQLLKQMIDLLHHKNGNDQIQDFIWYLSKARVSVDVEHLADRASRARVKADTAAAYKSLQTVGSLLLTNSDFRLFLTDVAAVGREVLSDTAFAVSKVSEDAGRRLEPSNEEQEALRNPGADGILETAGSTLGDEVATAANVVKDSATEVAQEAGRSLGDKMTDGTKDTILDRLKQAVLKLRYRRDYSDSVSTLALLLQRYALVYSHAARDVLDVAEDDLSVNPETDRALHNFWLLVTSFGDQKAWNDLNHSFGHLMDHGREDPRFDRLVRQLGNALQDMLTDPSFFDHAGERFQAVKARSRALATNPSLRDDIDGLVTSLRSALLSVGNDQDITRLRDTVAHIAKILSPTQQNINQQLVDDAIHIFVPLIVQAVQYVPIPRLEIATPALDLLLENLILEPGVTVNDSSFLPYRLRIQTFNELDIRKARFRTASTVQTIVSVHVDGFSIRADEVGYWLRAHSGLLRLADEGVASFQLDEKGIDVVLDIEIGRDRLENILSLKSVRVHIHKLNYTLRKSRFSWLAWLFKPFIRPIIKMAMEARIASAIEEGLHFANRELLYARERLRATRISDPDDLWTFVKAVITRLVPPDDPDLYTRVGVDAGYGVFKGVYAPGSIVKTWNEEAVKAPQRIREGSKDGWRNEIFDIQARHLT